MFTKIQALNYRSLRYIDRAVNGLNVLVGPNASGKSTFIDVPGLLGDIVRDGLKAAIETRTSNWQDLTWMRNGNEFQLAVEADIPDEPALRKKNPEYTRARYELGLGRLPDSSFGILHEKFLLLNAEQLTPSAPPTLFPQVHAIPDSIWSTQRIGKRVIASKVLDGNDNYNSEVTEEGGRGWLPSFKFGPYKSALANLPADESRFPVAVWFRELLGSGVQKLVLNSQLIRQANPPGQRVGFRPDGSNLAWVVEGLIRSSPERFSGWLQHLQSALPDINSIRTVERPEDKHRYVVVNYNSVGDMPAWMVSDGTLRLLALTVVAYLPTFNGIFLIEEPENGIHPRAIEAMFDSLRSVYGAQVLVATHSPVILSIVDPKSVLCFAKTADGATDIVSGDEHPRLQEWRCETDLGSLFAAGILDHS